MMESARSPYLSVVIPVYNEEKIIAESLRRVFVFLRLKGFSFEILVADDGSGDSTAQTVQKIIDQNPDVDIQRLSSLVNRGKGDAVRRGVLASRGQYILITDADLSAPIKEVDKLIHALELDADVAIGSRALKAHDCDIRQSFKRKITGRIFNGLVRLLVFGGIRDTQCGFKCFRHAVAKVLFSEQKMDGFCFDVEILYLARLKKMKIKEVPVMWREGVESKVRLFRDSFFMFMDLLRVKSLHRRRA